MLPLQVPLNNAGLQHHSQQPDVEELPPVVKQLPP